MIIEEGFVEVLKTYRGSEIHNAFFSLLKNCKQLTVSMLADINLTDDKAKLLRGKLVAFNELENYFNYLSGASTPSNNVTPIKKTTE